MSRFAVLHQGAIGDFILALSVIQSVRVYLHADHVTAIATAPSARLAAGRSALDAWCPPERVALHTLFRDGPADARLLEALSDAPLILSFLSAPDEPVHERLCTATDARIVSVDPRPVPQTITQRQHITGQWTAAIREQGLPIPAAQPARIHREKGRAIQGRGRGAAGLRILIHPGAGGPSKCWPANRFSALAEALLPADIHWMLGPAEVECDPDRFAPIHQRAAAYEEPLWIEADLLGAAERISSTDLYIGNDAGMTHVAAALGVATIALYGPTDPKTWRPLGDHVLTVSPPNPSPMTTVTIEEVISRIHVD